MSPASEFRIVPLTAEHLPAALEIERAVFRDPWTLGAFREALVHSDKCWAATADGELAGYLITQWVLDEVHVLNLAVAPLRHRSGIGSGLLTFLLELCRRSGMRDVYLEVRVSNAAAIALYEKFGFYELTVRSGYYPDGEDARVMHLELDEVPAAIRSGHNDSRQG